MATITMPAGMYYIGDPCYVINQWDEFLMPMWSADGKRSFIWKDQKCVVFQTAYGDGVYEDRDGRSYPVDAGIIGAIPYVACDESPEAAGNVFNFKEDWLAETDGETLRFGSHVISTGDDDGCGDDHCEYCGR